MNTRSLKFRLVAWYAGWLTLLFMVFGVFVYASLAHHLEKSLRDALLRRARVIADAVQRSTTDWRTTGAEIQKLFAPEVNNRFSRVLEDGRVQYVSGKPVDRSFDPAQVPLPTTTQPGESSQTRRLASGDEMLVVSVARNLPRGYVIVEEGASLASMQATLHGWLFMLVLGLGLLIFGAVLGGALLVRWALQPVDHIIRSAEQISSRNLSERLPVPKSGDEIERLSMAVNSMIHRLDTGFQQTQRFFADASHELRTPLTIIQGELEAISKSPEAQPDVRDVAASGLEEVERLRNIVEGLFALSRLDAGEAQENFESVDLAELAATTTDQMCLLAEDKHITLLCSGQRDVFVHGSRPRLKQVIVNLLDNAIKYTAEGGRVDVTICTRDGLGVLEVADNGMGIPADALPRVFDRFFRADKARSRTLGGAGLGLSIVKSICNAHHGRVSVHSREGVGTRFTVELPLTAPSGER